MTQEDIHQLLHTMRASIPGTEVELVETHISWVILTPAFAYKIKKPRLYTFLNFSNLELRKFYCERELVLNRRLTQDMYLSVEPVWKGNGIMGIGQTPGEETIIDYAVVMKRMDETRQMNILLEKGAVTEKHIEQIAEVLATFHAGATVIHTPLRLEDMKADFNDLLKVRSLIRNQLGDGAVPVIEEAVRVSDRFIDRYLERILERHTRGFTIDGHGDLHSKNILLLETPVIFDCIEFSDHLRQVDVLSEIAFFCMDLDFYGASDLATHFLEVYTQMHPCLEVPADREIFRYYKFYRANVRVKVNALKRADADDEKESKKRHELVFAYFNLLQQYLQELIAGQ